MVWEYAADDGLVLGFFLDGKDVGRLSFVWQTILTDQPPGADLPIDLMRLLVETEVIDREGKGELEKVAEEIRNGLARSVVRDRVAKVMCIPAHDWISPESAIETDIDDFRELYPNAEDIEPVN
jgi:hypothetical protein